MSRIILGLVCTFFTSILFAGNPKTLYVSTSGNDSNDGLNSITAFASLAKALESDSLANGDTCGTYGATVRLNSQSEVDSFQACKYYRGSINVDGQNTIEDIIDLTPLNVIRSIEGNLSVQYTLIEDLEALDSLQLIKGAFALYLNDSIESIEGMNALTYSNDINIANHDALKVIDGFNSLEDLDHIQINWNYNLDTIKGFNALDSLIGLNFSDLTSLEVMNAFSNLTIADNVSISNSPKLKDFSGLANLSDLSTFLNIEATGLSNLNDLGNLSYLKSLSILENDSLVDISALASIDSVGTLSIKYNEQLATCCQVSHLFVPGPIIDIVDNAAGCNNQYEIEDSCSIEDNIVTNVSTLLEGQFTVYPNPANDQIQVSYQMVSNQIQISVYDIVGNEVNRINETGTNGLYTTSMDLGHLTNGIYFIELKEVDRSTVKKLIIE